MAPEIKMLRDRHSAHRDASMHLLRNLISSAKGALDQLGSGADFADGSFLQHVPNLAHRLGALDSSHHAIELMTIMWNRVDGPKEKQARSPKIPRPGRFWAKQMNRIRAAKEAADDSSESSFWRRAISEIMTFAEMVPDEDLTLLEDLANISEKMARLAQKG